MHMTQIQSVLNEKKITFSYTEEDNCGSDLQGQQRDLRRHRPVGQEPYSGGL